MKVISVIYSYESHLNSFHSHQWGTPVTTTHLMQMQMAGPSDLHMQCLIYDLVHEVPDFPHCINN